LEEFVILRVISGTAKGHKLKTIKGLATRPTSDKVKELCSTFWLLCTGYKCFGHICGHGSLGIEALSRGADSAVFVDKAESVFYNKGKPCSYKA